MQSIIENELNCKYNHEGVQTIFHKERKATKGYQIRAKKAIQRIQNWTPKNDSIAQTQT